MNTETDINTTSKANAAGLTEFLKSVELLSLRLEAVSFKGVNGAEMVREGRNCAGTPDECVGSSGTEK